MISVKRRAVMAGATLLAALPARKLMAAAGLPDLSRWTPTPGKPLPEFKWTDAAGAEHTAAELAGQGMVVNFWATWCVPCVAEMPALDDLARQMERDKVVVLALSSDRGGASAVERFYRDKGVRTLAVLLDPRGDAARAFGSRGIPTTIVIDRKGQERGRLEGAADWASAASVAKLRQVFGPA